MPEQNQPHPQADIRRRLNDIGQAVNERLPANYGFFVFTFPFNGSPNDPVNYASNADREDVIRVLKIFLLHNGVDENWLKRVI